MKSCTKSTTQIDTNDNSELDLKREKHFWRSFSVKKPIKRRLNNIEHVRQALADLYNRLNRDELKPAKAGKLCYILQCLARILEISDLEKRLTALERKL